MILYLLTGACVCVCVQERSTEKGGGGPVLSECEDLKQEQSRISRLERQAQEFLNAVFHRKGTCTHTHTHTRYKAATSSCTTKPGSKKNISE